MRRAPKPPYDEPLKWLKGNGHDLGPLTGQDTPALLAVAWCWELYCHSDSDGQRAALLAVRALLGGMQEKVWPLAKALIARALDWGDVERLWPLVEPRATHTTDLESKASP